MHYQVIVDETKEKAEHQDFLVPGASIRKDTYSCTKVNSIWDIYNKKSIEVSVK